MKFTEQFNKYACVGDNISVEIDNVIYTASIQPDHNTTPEEFECYTNDEVKRFYNDEWRYVGLVIEADADDWKKTFWHHSIWGVDINLGDDDRPYLMELANEGLAMALEEVAA